MLSDAKIRIKHVIINTIRLEMIGKLVKNPVLTLYALHGIMIKSPRGESRGAKKITKNFRKGIDKH